MVGAVIALPFLETFAPKRALAAGHPPFAIIMRQANGVAQQQNPNAKKTDEPERFWPKALGALTEDGLASQGDRALSLLSDYADKLRTNYLGRRTVAFVAPSCFRGNPPAPCRRAITARTNTPRPRRWPSGGGAL